MKKILYAALVLAAATASQARADAPVQDILGVSTGMPVRDAIKAFKSQNAKLTEQVAPPCSANIYAQCLPKFKGKEFTLNDTLADQTNGPVKGGREIIQLGIGGVEDEYLTHLHREIIYDQTDPARPTVNDVTKGLAAKYGEPSARDSSGGLSGMYAYDLNGQLARGRNACMPDHWVNFDQSFNSGCGLRVSWYVQQANDNPLLVQRIRILVKNDQLFFKSLNERKAAIAAEQRAQVEAAKGTAPKY